MAYQEYPKELRHPQFRPAVIAQWDPKIKDPAQQPQGQPAKFPPVIVHNLDQEQEYASRGYLPAGVSDPDAYLRATIGAEQPGTYRFQEYPKWLYRVGDDGTGEVQSKMVHTKPEERRLGAGWAATPDAARELHEQALNARSAAATNDRTPAAVDRVIREKLAEKAPAKRKYTRRAKSPAKQSAPAAGGEGASSQE